MRGLSLTRRVRGLAAVAALVAALAALMGPSTAMACSCSSLPAERTVLTVPIIFEGRVIGVRRSRPANGGFEAVAATMEITSAWKGDLPKQVQVHGSSAYAACGFDDFPVGQPMLVLAYPRETGGGLTTSSCTMGLAAGEARGPLMRLLGSMARDRALLEQMANEQPRIAMPTVRLARHFEQWRDFSAALAIYAQLANDYPALQIVQAAAGRIFFQQKNYQNAIIALGRATELRPADRDSSRLLGQARFHAGQRQVIGTMDFRGFEARDLDIRGQDLSGRDFSEARLDGLRLDGGRLIGARLAGARISGSFVRADLTNADMEKMTGGGDFTAARMGGVRMTSAMLYGATLQDADLRGASASDVNLGGAQAARVVLAGADLSLALLHGADLMDADLSSASLVGAVLARATLCGATLVGADLEGVDLRGARSDASTRWPAGFDPIAAGVEVAAVPGCRPASR